MDDHTNLDEWRTDISRNMRYFSIAAFAFTLIFMAQVFVGIILYDGILRWLFCGAMIWMAGSSRKQFIETIRARREMLADIDAIEKMRDKLKRGEVDG